VSRAGKPASHAARTRCAAKSAGAVAPAMRFRDLFDFPKRPNEGGA